MRAMILGAGLGTRLLPLTALRPKPALPVRGIPVVGYALALLARHGIREVAINVHHLPHEVERAARAWCPAGVSLRFSREEALLGTGGGIRQLADFLRGSDPCLVLAGDMLLDVDLGALVRGHQRRGDSITLLLRDDPRGATFGTIGTDAEGRVRRIGRRFDLGGEERAGVYAHATVVSARALDVLPPERVFSHLDRWVMPRIEAGAGDVRGELLAADACAWEPVGTPDEYLRVNLQPMRPSYLDADERARRAGTRFEGDVILGAGARLGPGVHLARAVVWDGESVPAGFRGEDGVFAGGRFHPCPAALPARDAEAGAAPDAGGIHG